MKILVIAALASLSLMPSAAFGQAKPISNDQSITVLEAIAYGSLHGIAIPVDETHGLPVRCISGCSGGGGGGGAGDASASNQTTQIARETSIRDQIGAVSSPATGSTNWLLTDVRTALLGTLTVNTHAVTQSGTWSMTVGGTLPPFAAPPTVNLGTLNGAATAANQVAATAALPAKDSNGDLRVPTVSVTPFYVPLPVNTSTEILAPSTTRIDYEVQCAGTAAVGLSRVHASLTSPTPSAGGVDWVIPAGTTPAYLPAYVSGAGVTGYTTTAQACWGVSYARQ